MQCLPAQCIAFLSRLQHNVMKSMAAWENKRLCIDSVNSVLNALPMHVSSIASHWRHKLTLDDRGLAAVCCWGILHPRLSAQLPLCAWHLPGGRHTGRCRKLCHRQLSRYNQSAVGKIWHMSLGSLPHHHNCKHEPTIRLMNSKTAVRIVLPALPSADSLLPCCCIFHPFACASRGSSCKQ